MKASPVTPAELAAASLVPIVAVTGEDEGTAEPVGEPEQVLATDVPAEAPEAPVAPSPEAPRPSPVSRMLEAATEAY